MHNRRFGGEIERLRSPERLARIDVERVVALSLDGAAARTMLDVGTGSGLFAQAFAARGLRVAGVDLRADMLEAARGFVPAGAFRLAHMEALPFAGGAFSLVFLGHVLHEADDLARALAEAYRVAALRAVVLEWPYAVQEFGPPLEHRLPTAQVEDAARLTGFARVTHHALAFMSLFVLDK